MAGIFDGITDFTKSILDAAPGVIGAINQPKTTAPKATADAYGRKPGEVGYGTTTPPASTTPKWLMPVAIGGGVLVVVILLFTLFRKKK